MFGNKSTIRFKSRWFGLGKGVLILNSIEDAKAELKEMLTEGKFGSASTKVLSKNF